MPDPTYLQLFGRANRRTATDEVESHRLAVGLLQDVLTSVDEKDPDTRAAFMQSTIARIRYELSDLGRLKP